MKNILVYLIVAMSLVAGVQAEEAAFQLSLFPNVALYDDTTTINGVAINVWGLNPQHALAIGVINGSYGDSHGISIGGLNYSENYTGFQWGFVNFANANFTGWQAACVNYTADTLDGFQLGFVNYAGRLTGFQLGLFNMAAQADHGLQVGLINLLPETRTWFEAGLANQVAPVMIIANWRF